MDVERIGPKTRDLLATLLERPSYHYRAAFTPLEMRAALADGDAWLVPPEARPTCPLSQKPCTSWSCLQDVCVDPEDDDVTLGDYLKMTGQETVIRPKVSDG